MNIRLSTLFARNDDFGFVTMAVPCLVGSHIRLHLRAITRLGIQAPLAPVAGALLSTNKT